MLYLLFEKGGQLQIIIKDKSIPRGGSGRGRGKISYSYKLPFEEDNLRRDSTSRGIT